MAYRHTFTNENGRKITVRGRLLDSTLLTIRIEGPTSLSEWIVTIDEAVQVYRILSALLAAHKKAVDDSTLGLVRVHKHQLDRDASNRDAGGK